MSVSFAPAWNMAASGSPSAASEVLTPLSRHPGLVRSRAPLRLGLAGGGTDVPPCPEKLGGYVLNATIALYAYATITPRSDGKVQFIAADRRECVEYDASGPAPASSPLGLHAAVYKRFVRDYNHGQPLPITLTTSCEVPAGSGLGSSSTLVVAALEALREYLRVPMSDHELARTAWIIERQDVGLAGGMQDQYAAAFGGFNFIEFQGSDHVTVNSLRINPWIVAELEARLILCYTGLSREGATIISDQSANVGDRDTKAIDALRVLKRDAIQMKEYLLRGDLAGFADVLGSSWEAKKRLAERITNNTIEEVYQLALQAGAQAGKISGAGGGGFMMLMVEPTRRPQVLATLTSAGFTVLPVSFTDQRAVSWRLP